MTIIRTIQVLFKLLPSVLALRKDRKKWINQENNQIDSEQFRKNARKVLNTFISLGPVYIKLGQWLSSRADILPQPYLEELSKLQDSVPPAPYDQVKPIIEKEIGPIDKKFDQIDQKTWNRKSRH
jgi:predicted unusual protein kinase regulating ubiquinone biosynthesis (AarF/ABC1/UbiB family)